MRPSDIGACLAPWSERLEGLDGVGPPVVVGCSGGADSLALLAFAAALRLEPVAVHVDHGIRPDAGGEADFVAGCATRLAAGFRSERVVVEPGANLEARARDARYEALERARASIGATAVLVGHTADDQAETVILNLLRGSASGGLGAMAVHRDRRRPADAQPPPRRHPGGVRGARSRAARRPDERRSCAAAGVDPPRGAPDAGGGRRPRPRAGAGPPGRDPAVGVRGARPPGRVGVAGRAASRRRARSPSCRS